ncbi:MAG TPA: GTPase HflX [Gemmatimonadaceae bacterium]|nr:GTPase HflX [Gemmatimonadaceae bacterium]
MGAPLKASRARHHLAEHLEELAELTDTAGAVIVGEVTQMLDRPNPGTYLGKGKLEELRHEVERTDATLVIFDDELTPAQARNIEQALGKRIMDRAELILDIFATRARTAEAKMQVELAQLEYLLPRLTRMWTHLEKFRGGIGMRGPGETQLETDRRLINHRIRVLRERLVDVQKAREVQRQSRRAEFRASLVGYTNVGKSSILRALSASRDVFVEDRLFATLDPLTREVGLGENQRVLVTDTVGFIRKLPHHLVASFRATLEEARETELLLHVIDASHPTWEEQRQVVDQVLAELGLTEYPVLHVFNKIDRLAPADLAALQERARNLLPNSVFVSAVVEDGLEPLRRALLAAVRRQRPVTELRVPFADGKLLAELHRAGEVLSQRPDGDHWVISARLDEATLGRLRRQGAEVRDGG